jgi:hypothetical protein
MKHISLSKGYISTKNGIVGKGLLLNSIVKEPIKKEEGKGLISNRMIGITTGTSTLPQPVHIGEERTGQGIKEDILNGLNKISFGKNVKKNNRENIRFVF